MAPLPLALSMVLFGAVERAHAGIVHQPPAEARQVGLLVCADVDDCADRMFWVEHEPALAALPIVMVEALLEQNTATVAQGEAAAATFQQALVHARTEFDAHHWKVAEFALDDAGRALDAWRGTPANQDLFSLWYMRGAVSLAQGYHSNDTDFRTAAATAWNRSVTLPLDLEPYATTYYEAVAELIHEPPGTLVLEAKSGAPIYSVDGIPLGPAPLRIEILPGVHRVTALEPNLTQEWRRTITVVSRKTTTTSARFTGGDDPQWASDSLAHTIDAHTIDAELANLLSDWADTYGVRQVRLLRLDPVVATTPGRDGVQDPLAVYTLHDVYYEPKARRFSTVK